MSSSDYSRPILGRFDTLFSLVGVFVSALALGVTFLIFTMQRDYEREMSQRQEEFETSLMRSQQDFDRNRNTITALRIYQEAVIRFDRGGSCMGFLTNTTDSVLDRFLTVQEMRIDNTTVGSSTKDFEDCLEIEDHEDWLPLELPRSRVADMWYQIYGQLNEFTIISALYETRVINTELTCRLLGHSHRRTVLPFLKRLNDHSSQALPGSDAAKSDLEIYSSVMNFCA